MSAEILTPSKAPWPPPDVVAPRASKTLPAAPPAPPPNPVPVPAPVAAPPKPLDPAPAPKPPLPEPPAVVDCEPLAADRPGNRSALDAVFDRPPPGATWPAPVSNDPDEPPPKISLSTRASCRASPYFTR